MTRVAVVVGNPRPASRTRTTALGVARALTGTEPDLVVDLAEHGARLLDPADTRVSALVEEVATADLVVVASPTYKATYTGLLKLFLDRFAPHQGTGLRGIAVPLLVGAGPAHALAPESLRAVLVEIGAPLTTAGLYVLESAYDDPAALEPWLARVRPTLDVLLHRPTEVPA